MGPLLALLLLVPLHAQDEVPAGSDLAFEPTALTEPLPLHGDPWDLQVLAFLVPPQDPAWLTSTDPFRNCVLDGTLEPGGDPAWRVRDCPEPMVPAALAAAAVWRLVAADPEQARGPTRFELRFVVRYAEQLATMTAHAALDPGAEEAFAGAIGVPGVKLVHPAALQRLKPPRVPRAARKAGIAAQTCSAALVVDPAGRARGIRVDGCPEALVPAAQRAAQKARYSPRVVDGMTEEQELAIEVAFR